MDTAISHLELARIGRLELPSTEWHSEAQPIYQIRLVVKIMAAYLSFDDAASLQYHPGVA